MLVVVFAVAGRVRFLVPIVSVAEPSSERFTEFGENSLTGLAVQIHVAFTPFEVGLKVENTGNLAASIPDTVGGPSPNVPELAGGETKRIEVVTHLRVVADACAVGPRDL